jgi:serine O-acetyltransferase
VIKIFKGIVIFLNSIRCSPHLMVFYLHKSKSIITLDIIRWLKKERKNYKIMIGLIYLLTYYPEFRNLFYIRVGRISHFLNLICPKLSTLYIFTKDIGEGLYFSHGFSSGISAKSIGKNCTIYHHVIIGNHKGFPIIRDNVTIHAGAVIIGNISIGSNSIIGANATVYKNVPDNCTVYPAPCLIMKWNSENIEY